MTRKLVPETRRPILSPCTKPERVAKDAIVTAGPQLSALHCQVINSTPAIVELTPQCLTANYNHFQIQTLHRVHSIERRNQSREVDYPFYLITVGAQ